MKIGHITVADTGIAHEHSDTVNRKAPKVNGEYVKISDVVARNWDCRRYIEACRAHTMTKQETDRFWGRTAYYRRRYNPKA